MEGPSLVLACEEFSKYVGQPVTGAKGTAKLPFPQIKKQKLKRALSWGKHFLLDFGKLTLRIHFLMFGSYRINNPRENRIPKMQLTFGKDQIYFYSCAIKVLEEKPEDLYDWSTDIMSKKWSAAKALTKLKALDQTMVCDALMDQEIFSGVGNIIKNEVLFNLKLHPEARLGSLAITEKKALAKEARNYSLQFYRWKKIGELKRNWKIFRKRNCPVCNSQVIKEKTGTGQRVSFYCPRCQRGHR